MGLSILRQIRGGGGNKVNENSKQLFCKIFSGSHIKTLAKYVCLFFQNLGGKKMTELSNPMLIAV